MTVAERKELRRKLLIITQDSREKLLPIAYIESKIHELFDEKLG